MSPLRIHPEQPTNAKLTTQEHPARLTLVSSSLRRRRLLEAHGVAFDVRSPELDDGALTPGDAAPEQWVVALAHLKAWSVALTMTNNEPQRRRDILLGADTIAVLDGRLIGQPRDRADACRMLESFENTWHDVLTGVTIIDALTGERELFFDRARVHFGSVGNEPLERYLRSNGWRGKAGAYNLEDRLNEGWPIEHLGDASTIMGLPMKKLLPMLTRWGVIVDAGPARGDR